MAPAKFQKIGIVIKHRIEEANNLAQELAAYFQEKKLKVYFASEAKDVCTLAMGVECATKEDLIKNCDLLVVLGGDGTFISAARRMVERSIPILGINMGTLGFLTEVRKTEAKKILDEVLAGKYKVSERIMLESTLIRSGKEISNVVVVNDAVVHKAAIARIIELEISINGSVLTKMRGDGLIISTPSGSTAYSLAAGGPAIEPTVPALVISPICPHALSLRPLVIDDSSEIALTLKNGTETILTWDGQTSVQLQEGDVIRIRKYGKHVLSVIQPKTSNYFDILREKLKYGVRE